MLLVGKEQLEVSSRAFLSENLPEKTVRSDAAYTYYANGLKKAFTGPDGVTISYSHDENNRLAGISIPGQGLVTYNYDREHWNSPAGKMLPGGRC